MGFFSFLGRVLFASIFILCAWQIVMGYCSRYCSMPTECLWLRPHLRLMISVCIYMRFNDFGEDGGPAAKEWDPKLALLKKHIDGTIGKTGFHIDGRTFVAASIVLKGLGGLLFVIGNYFGAFLLMTYLIVATPLLFDFYNYGAGQEEFFRLLHDFVQHMALFGALLFYLGMMNSISRKQPKRKAPKSKTA